MPTPELANLRTRCAEAYSEWRACASDGPWSEDGDAQCRLLKRELDSAAQALFIARRPNLLTGG